MSSRPPPPARSRSRPAARSAASDAEQQASALASETVEEPPSPAEFAADVYPFGTRITVGEDAETIRDAEAYFLEAIRPDPGAETMLVYSIIDHTRELEQLEKTKQVLIRLGLCDFLAEAMKPSVTRAEHLGGAGDMAQLAKSWALNVSGAEADVRRRLAMVNLTLDHVLANGYALSLGQLDRVSTLMERAERRRDRMLRTLEQSRAIRSLVDLRGVQVRRATAALVIDATAQLGSVPDTHGRADG